MANLFSDGFESGDLSAWSSALIDGGDLSAAVEAALHGSYGLNVLMNDTTEKSVRDDTPAAEKRYRARFYVNINSLSMEDNEEFGLMYLLNSSNIVGTTIILKYTTATGYEIIMGTKNDAGAYSYINAPNISNGVHAIEFDWKASSAPGANDGTSQLWIDGNLIGSGTGKDTDTRQVDYVKLGAMNIYAAITGTFFLDDFASNNDGSPIGLISNGFSKLTLLGVG